MPLTEQEIQNQRAAHPFSPGYHHDLSDMEELPITEADRRAATAQTKPVIVVERLDLSPAQIQALTTLVKSLPPSRKS